MNLERYIYLYYCIIAWAVVFIFIKPKRLKVLLPVAVLSGLIVFSVEITLIKLDLYRFNDPIVSIGGVPLFLLLWGAPSGMVILQLMKKEFIKKIFIIILLSFAVLGLESVSEFVGAASHLGIFNNFVEVCIDFLMIVLVVWISEGLWGNKIYSSRNE